MKRSIFGLPVCSDLSREDKHLLYTFYSRFHRKMWMYKQAYKFYKKRDLCLTIASTVVTMGGLAGTAMFLPIIAIGFCGIILGVISKKKNYAAKIEMAHYAYTNYEKILHSLESYWRGQTFDRRLLIETCKKIEDTITDFCPAIDEDRWIRMYENIFDTDEMAEKVTECEA